MEEFLITAVKFIFEAAWFIAMAVCGAFGALYLMRVNHFNILQNWIMALAGAMITGPLIIWIMDISPYYIIMHFMGAILTIWIYKFVTKDFIVQDQKIDISRVYDDRQQDEHKDEGK